MQATVQWQRSAAGKVTVGLASNQPCVRDSAVYPSTAQCPRKRRQESRLHSSKEHSVLCSMYDNNVDNSRLIFGRPFVKRFALCYRSVASPVCLSCLSVCLSVTLVYCGQTVRPIKMKLGLQVGLGPGHIVLGGDPAPLHSRSTALQFSAHISCGQMAAWIKMSLGMEVGHGPGDFVLDGDPAPPPQKGGGAPPQFSAHVYCGHTAAWIKMPLGTEVGRGPDDVVLDGDPASPSPKRV